MRIVQSILQNDTLRARTIRSAMLTVISFGGSNALRLGSNLVLTRILFPEAFGLMALVQMFLFGLQMFSDFGISDSVIRSKRGDDPRFLDTAWTVQVLRGVVLALGAAVLAGPFASFYDEPKLRELLPVVGLTAIFLGISSVNIITVNRNLILGRLTLLELGSQFLGIVIMIVAAFMLQSVWALIIGSLTQTASKAMLSHIILPGRAARLSIEGESLRELFHFGKWVFISTIAGFLVQNGDRAILGRFVSLTDLALYNIALMLAMVPITLKLALVSRVLFPLYCSSPPIESAKNRERVLRTRFMMTGASFIVSVPLILFGKELVEFLYDSRYYMAGDILPVLSFVWLFQIITLSHSPILLARGDTRTYALFIIFSAIIRTLLMLAGASNFGIVGVVIGVLLAEFILYPILVFFVYRYRAWDWRHDSLFGMAAVALAVLALWINPDALVNFFALVDHRGTL
jgi:O-antigen/teichoic acid export membrane protein